MDTNQTPPPPKTTVIVQDRPSGLALHPPDVFAVATFVAGLSTVITGPFLESLLTGNGITSEVAHRIVLDFAAVCTFAGLVARVFKNKTGTNVEVALTAPDSITPVAEIAK